MSGSSNRIEELDLLKGICIFLMVFDHVWWGKYCHSYVNSFHMPVFFFTSGYLLKNRPLKILIIKKTKSLIVPYLCFSLLYVFTCLLLGNVFVSQSVSDMIKAVILFPTDMANMPLAPALWFLPCLFTVEVLFALVIRVSRRYYRCLILAFCVPIILYSMLCDAMLPFAIEPVATGLIFYLLGFEAKNKVVNKLSEIKEILLFLAIHMILALINGSVDMRSARYNNVIIYFLCAALGIYTYGSLMHLLEKVDNYTIRIIKGCLCYLSINSMAFLCMNQPFIKLFNILLPSSDSLLFVLLSKMIIFIFSLIMCCLLNEILSKCKINFILGRN